MTQRIPDRVLVSAEPMRQEIDACRPGRGPSTPYGSTWAPANALDEVGPTI